jgi:hypothetical protein
VQNFTHGGHPRQSPTAALTSAYLPVFSSPSATCKLLETLVIYVLKRLASAVQLRPWPPYSKANITFSILHTFDVGGPKTSVDVGPTNLDQIVNEIQIGTGAIAKAGWG